MRVNMNKTKNMVNGERQKPMQKAARWQCGVCSRGVGSNSIECTSSQAASQYYICRCSLLLPTEQRGLSVSLSVALVSPAKTAAPIEMPFRLRTWVGPRNHVLDGGPDPPLGRGNFEGAKGHPSVKYRDTLWSPVRKRLKRSRCCLGCGLGWAQGIMCQMEVQRC